MGLWISPPHEMSCRIFKGIRIKLTIAHLSLCKFVLPLCLIVTTGWLGWFDLGAINFQVTQSKTNQVIPITWLILLISPWFSVLSWRKIQLKKKTNKKQNSDILSLLFVGGFFMARNMLENVNNVFFFLLISVNFFPKQISCLLTKDIPKLRRNLILSGGNRVC